MRNLNESLRALDDHYLEMLKYISRNFDTNLEMLQTRPFNSSLYGEAKVIEDLVNAFEVKLKEDAIVTIARFQPAAKNLRNLVMIINSVRVLERMGDLLKANLMIIRDIEKKNPELTYLLAEAVYPAACKIKGIYEMYVKAYIEKDLKLLYDIVTLDEEIDEIMEKNFNRFLDVMKEKPENVEAGTLIALIDKKFERLSDHIMHLVMDLIYIMNGENLRKAELSQAGKEIIAGE